LEGRQIPTLARFARSCGMTGGIAHPIIFRHHSSE
jgi:hypothetical protein